MPAYQNRKRTKKTEEILTAAMSALLKNHALENIKVKDICEQAQIHRAVFYAYFTDKYDLLNYMANSKAI